MEFDFIIIFNSKIYIKNLFICYLFNLDFSIIIINYNFYYYFKKLKIYFKNIK